jgi:3-oxoacyl-[acyl-carrier protein] reductase
MARRVFITGGSRGIGRAVAQRFAEAHFDVVAPGRDELDLASTDSVRAFIQRQGRLEADVLINNAGENKINLLRDMPLEDWNRILTVNLTSAFLLTQAVAPFMVRQRWGRIVNISSIYALLGRPGRAVYSASKSGLNGLTRAAAVEYGPDNVLVNAVCPGFVETALTRKNNSPEQIQAFENQTALRRMAQTGEIAEFIFFLGSDANTYITGQTIPIDGGFSCQ